MTQKLDPADEERLKRIEEILQNPDKAELAEEFFDDLNDMIWNSPALSQLFNSDVRYFSLDGRSDITPEPVNLSIIAPNDSAGNFELSLRANYDEPPRTDDSEAHDNRDAEESELDLAPDLSSEDTRMTVNDLAEPELMTDPHIDAIVSTPTQSDTATEATVISDIAPIKKKGEVLDSAPKEAKPIPKKKKKAKKAVSKKHDKKPVKELPKSVKTSDDLDTKFMERQKKIQDILNDGKGSISSNSV